MTGTGRFARLCDRVQKAFFELSKDSTVGSVSRHIRPPHPTRRTRKPWTCAFDLAIRWLYTVLRLVLLVSGIVEYCESFVFWHGGDQRRSRARNRFVTAAHCVRLRYRIPSFRPGTHLLCVFFFFLLSLYQSFSIEISTRWIFFFLSNTITINYSCLSLHPGFRINILHENKRYQNKINDNARSDQAHTYQIIKLYNRYVQELKQFCYLGSTIT